MASFETAPYEHERSRYEQPWLTVGNYRDASSSPLPSFDNHYPLTYEPKEFIDHYERFDDHHRYVSSPPLSSARSHGDNQWSALASYCDSAEETSPFSSGKSSNTFSDLHSATLGSPDLGLDYPPQYNLHGSIDVVQSIEMGPTSCSLNDVQPQSDYLPFDEFGSYIHDLPPPHFVYEQSPAPMFDYEYNSSARNTPSSDRGRPARKHSHSISLNVNNLNKINKRHTSVSCRRSTYSKSGSPARFSRSSPTGNSNFPCPLAPYGCTSSFGSKNEWKRHVNTQHLRLDLWRCDQCVDRETRPNDFNRKDLFVQHLRRMHHRPSDSTSQKNNSRRSSEEQDPAVIAAEERCHIRLRLPPATSCCLFCPAEFEGPSSWEERMEHVGRHLEQDRREGKEAPSTSQWRHDEGFEQWLEAEGLIAKVGYGGPEWRIADTGRRRDSVAPSNVVDENQLVRRKCGNGSSHLSNVQIELTT